MITFLGVLVAVVVVDVLLCLALEPYGAHSELVWTDYRATSNVDTILVGSSYTAYGLDPREFDKELDSHAFNMATPGQSVHDTLTTIRSVSEERQLDRVVICLGYYSIAAYPRINSSVMLTQAKCMGESPVQALADIGNLVFDEYYFDKLLSLSCAFPWGYDHVDYTFEAIRNNIDNRLAGDVFAAGAQYSEAAGEGWSYECQGYGGMRHTLPAKNSQGQVFIDNLGTPFYQGNLDAYTQICALCKERGIPLYVIAAPYTPSAIAAYGDTYWTDMPQLKAIAEESGATYMDLNLIHRDVLDLDLSCFYDRQHLCTAGATKASAVLAQLIGRVENGEDVSGLFYGYDAQGRAAWEASIDFVDSVDCTSEKTDDGIVLTASVVTGTNTPVAYKFEVLDEATGTYQVLRDYDADPVCLIPTSDDKPVTFRLSAQSTNGQQDTPRWLEATVS